VRTEAINCFVTTHVICPHFKRQLEHFFIWPSDGALAEGKGIYDRDADKNRSRIKGDIIEQTDIHSLCAALQPG